MPDLVGRLRAAGCVFAEDEARILIGSTNDRVELENRIRRRIGGEPLESIVGWVEFDGRRVLVDPGVFVPRRRSEHLVTVAAQLLPPGRQVVVEMCCGAGAVATALGRRRPDLELHAGDIDPVAVATARRNLQPLGGRVHCGDLYSALPGELAGRITLIVANAPYVPTGELGFLPVEARAYEPRVALDGGDDGTAVQARLAAAAGAWLAPGGALVIETSRRQAESSAGRVRAAGLHTDTRTDDERGATAVVGRSART